MDREELKEEWWAKLKGAEASGWLDRTHLEVWIRRILALRPPEADWIVMIGDFWTYLINMENLDSAKRSVSGEQIDEGFRLLSSVRRVIIPICIQDIHWVVGYFDLNYMFMIIYSSSNMGHVREELTFKLTNFKSALSDLFTVIGDPGREAISFLFRWDYAENVPQ